MEILVRESGPAVDDDHNLVAAALRFISQFESVRYERAVFDARRPHVMKRAEWRWRSGCDHARRICKSQALELGSSRAFLGLSQRRQHKYYISDGACAKEIFHRIPL